MNTIEQHNTNTKNKFPSIHRIPNFKKSYGEDVKQIYLFNYEIKNIVSKRGYEVFEGYEHICHHHEMLIDSLMENTCKNPNIVYGVTCKYVISGLIYPK